MKEKEDLVKKMHQDIKESLKRMMAEAESLKKKLEIAKKESQNTK
jgi:hypothetical protein